VQPVYGKQYELGRLPQLRRKRPKRQEMLYL
jgi:hypothetical protein